MTKRKDWPEWLCDAETHDARVKIAADGTVIWHGGVWRGGVWRGGVWLGGVWLGGVWRGGVWHDGVWHGGVWHGGDWHGGDWLGGDWRGGVWHGGAWHGGVWHARPVRVLDLGHDTRGFPRSLQRLNGDGVVRLRAGCHLLTLDEAERHWGALYANRMIGDDYLALIAYARTAAVQLGWA